MRELAIDGDIVAYSCGFAAENDSLENCLKTVDKRIANICSGAIADTYTIYLTGKNNFRYDKATLQPYKGNRKNKPKPRHLQDILEYLVMEHDAIFIDDEEADDALGKFLTEPTPNTRIIASLDKDLDMIPGEHYNWTKDNLYTMPPNEADMFFGTQLLTGDSTDNIPGLFKLTGVKATRPLREIMEQAYEEHGMDGMLEAVYTIYTTAAEENPDCRISKEGLDVKDVLAEIGALLWIRRYKIDEWQQTCGTKTPEEGELFEGESSLGKS